MSLQGSSIEARYVDLTSRSRAHYARARTVLPGGATRSLNSWAPYPLYLAGGKGCDVWDLDGRTYLDLLGNYTGLILGHAHPALVDSVEQVLRRGTSFSFSTELEHRLAEMIVQRVPSVQMLRFTGSGTEAAMFALRLARAATGRPLVAKMEGGFHGAYDEVAVSVRPPLEACRDGVPPLAVPEGPGLPGGLTERVVVLPFNQPEETASLIEAHQDDLAAVIVEPVLGVGGMIPADPRYLALLRDLCTRWGITLIFDEVITLRLAIGGGQEVMGVIPDLTVMGKIIGGGLPVGAYGGREDLMGLLAARGGHDPYDPRSGGPAVYQGGTFTGNPLTLAAGIATLELLTSDVIARLNELGDRLRRDLVALFQRLEFRAQVTGIGSLFNVHLTDRPVVSFRDTRRVDPVLQQAFFLALLNEGAIIAARGMGAVCVPMDAGHLDEFLSRVERAVTHLRKAGLEPAAGVEPRRDVPERVPTR